MSLLSISVSERYHPSLTSHKFLYYIVLFTATVDISQHTIHQQDIFLAHTFSSHLPLFSFTTLQPTHSSVFHLLLSPPPPYPQLAFSVFILCLPSPLLSLLPFLPLRRLLYLFKEESGVCWETTGAGWGEI